MLKKQKNNKNNKNKIVKKALEPFMSGLAVGLSLGVLTIIMFIANPDIINQDKANTQKAGSALVIGVFSTIILLASLSVFYLGKNANKFVTKTSTEYVKSLIQNDPEFKEFKEVLDRPEAMKRIADFVANQLPALEQKQIADIILELNKFDNQESVKTACMNVMKIIQKYASTHEEFVDEVYAALGRENYNSYMEKFQATTGAFLNKQKIQ